MSVTTRARTTAPPLRPDPRGEVVAPDDLLGPRLRRRWSRTPLREIVAVLDPVRPARPGDHADPHDTVRPDPATTQRAAQRLTRHLAPGEMVAPTPEGRLRLRLRRGREDRDARPARLQAMAYYAVEALEATERGQDAAVVDLGVGWAPINRSQDAGAAERQAAAAADESLRQRDLQPRLATGRRRVRHPVVDLWSASQQVVLSTVAGLVLPFLALVGAYIFGHDVSDVLYWVLVGALTMTAATLWAESALALDPPDLPPAPPGPVPRATAVIAAYLPNEAETVLETLDHFLAQRYAGGLQVVLAYNSPFPMPVEDRLRALADEHADLVVLKVEDSSSKAQNVNAALRVADGELIGIFDADHHPAPGAFERAWRWIGDPEDPADVVQGHCVIRNGEESGLARLVAVEFEQIYAVSHPGRAQLHGFGIFGGSNGYWRAEALRRIRLRGSYLTEDIEASMRVLEAGGRIVSDPGLISRELAPESPRALWKQRMRWAQGWFQVSLQHLRTTLASPRLTLRQKLGMTYLLAWREVYPWLSLLTWPLLGFLAWRDGGLDMTSPIFLLLTLFITVSGPLQALAAWRLAVPEIRRHRSWFVVAAVANLVFYTEAKNLVNRVAQLKQLRGEHQWVVTPRRPAGGRRHPGASPVTSPATRPEVTA